MIEGGLDERWQGTPILALAAGSAPPAVHPLAERGQTIEHNIDEIAISLEIGAPGVGDGIELFAAFRCRGDIARFLKIGQRRIDDAGARAVPVRGFLLQELDDFIAVARLFGDERECDQP